VDWRVPASLALGAAALLGSAALEGASLPFLLAAPTAALVLGGTAAASLLHSPPGLWGAALRCALNVLRSARPVPDRRRDFVRWTTLARRQGLLALERTADREAEPLLRQGLRNLADGGGFQRLHEGLEALAETEVQPLEEAAELFEAAGGYAPIMGVVGAVLGLIQALQQLEDPQAMGPGVASAFLATLYGLALANLVLLPLAGRLRLVAGQRRAVLSTYIDGLMAISRREHPRRLGERLGLSP